ncbi:MAG TPA: SRPBCC family protein [Vicinamibacterales bacterium]
MKFERTIHIAAPADVVWSVIADVERWHEWTPSVRSIRLLDRGGLRIGSRAIVRQPRLAPALWKVTAIEPGREFTWRSGLPGIRVDARHAVIPIDDGSRATLSVEFGGIGGRLMARLLRELNARYLALEAEGLKRRSEERARAAVP